MSFIDKFLDVTTPLPRKIIRNLKLYRVVEERSKDRNCKLKNYREEYLKKIKEKEINNHDIISLKRTIDELQSEILSLSDYKLEIIKELNYIFESSFLNKISPIIEEGKKECQGQLNIPNNNYSSNSFFDSVNSKKAIDDLKKISELNEKKQKNDIKENKKQRKGKKAKAGVESLNNETQKLNLKEAETGQDVFCKCHQHFYGSMIQCDNCGEWFHYGCVGIKEGDEPKEWYCEYCKDQSQKKIKRKKNKTIK